MASHKRHRRGQATVKSGRQVLRLPTYHCSLNPTELVWSQVKGYVVRNNAKFTITEVKEQLLQGVQSVMPDHWKSCIRHIINVEELNMWKLDGLEEEVMKCNNINSDDDTDTDDSNAVDMEGTEYLKGRNQTVS
jgi:hypothetical protein